MNLNQVLEKMPLIAVLRHIKPEEAVAIGQVLIDKGFVCLEVPLNSPKPCESIRKLADHFGKNSLVGAGTVLTVKQVNDVANAGGKIIIMPHTNVEVIKEAKRLGLCCIPGIATPSEAFAALEAGADALKLFPADGLGPNVLKAIKAVLPEGVAIIPTGGVTPDKMADYMVAGAAGFGLGTALFRPGDTPDVVSEKATAFVDAMNEIKKDVL